ncbi:MAG TPA: methylated-DNA--[protein]-cysteine S-methyltransferase [Polyangiaceae bacterium]|nr:methylated-DNA--[protein]-cysteine S-methyltransferase [Polyangiaceae bacterium]
MAGYRYALFPTAIGRCAVVWGQHGIASVQLPEARVLTTRTRILTRFPAAEQAAPPAPVQSVIDAIVRLVNGESSDLTHASLDMSGVPPFHRRVYELARSIPPGRTLSYGQVAERLGSLGSARAVGQALARNPFAIVVPCHRVLAARGKIGGFTADGGTTTKRRLLDIEAALETPAELPIPHASVAAPSLFAGDGAVSLDASLAQSHLRNADRTLARLMDKVGPFRMQLKKTSTLFQALAEAIVYQQLTGKAAATIFQRVQALFPAGEPSPDRLLRLPEAKLRGAGLSRAKLLSLRDLAERSLAGELPSLEEAKLLDDEAIIRRLTHVRGIGRWTVEMLLMFRLGRPDVLPLDDYGIRKGFALTFRKPELPTAKQMQQRGLRWSPYRTVASWYLWRALELDAAPVRAAPRV